MLIFQNLNNFLKFFQPILKKSPIFLENIFIEIKRDIPVMNIPIIPKAHAVFGPSVTLPASI